MRPGYARGIYWILALALVAVFYLIYGVTEDVIKKSRPARRPPNRPKFIHPSAPALVQTLAEQTPQVGGYGTSEFIQSVDRCAEFPSEEEISSFLVGYKEWFDRIATLYARKGRRFCDSFAA